MKRTISHSYVFFLFHVLWLKFWFSILFVWIKNKNIWLKKALRNCYMACENKYEIYANAVERSIQQNGQTTQYIQYCLTRKIMEIQSDYLEGQSNYIWGSTIWQSSRWWNWLFLERQNRMVDTISRGLYEKERGLYSIVPYWYRYWHSCFISDDWFDHSRWSIQSSQKVNMIENKMFNLTISDGWLHHLNSQSDPLRIAKSNMKREFRGTR